MFMITTIILLMLTVALSVKLRELNRAQKIAVNTRINNSKLEDELKDIKNKLFTTSKELEEQKDRNKEILSSKKSSETRLGMVAEKLAPFLTACTHDPSTLTFLGQPIDYIAFNYDEGSITFIEIKSGNSKASKRQKIIKNIIKTGRIYYEELRINEKGVTSRTTKK